ncbi:MAG: hemerythrin domain-containing protein [Parafilimonas sp.]
MSTTSLIKMQVTVDNEMHVAATALIPVDINDIEMKNNFLTESYDATFSRHDTAFLIDYIIKTHHSFAKRNTIIIYNLIQKVTYRHSYQHPELKKFIEVAFCFFQDLLNQMIKEEEYIFPGISEAIKDKKTNSNAVALQGLKQQITLQLAEHKKTLNYLKVFREITNDYQIPCDASWHYISLFEKMKELENDLSKHFHLEDEILYNAIIQRLLK